jgi:CDP-diacylglycerol--glycerol-3-phosphate 3-phosphatidyltransferase
MNVPNVLTLFRILLTFVFIVLLTKEGLGSKIFALIIFTLASLTDFLDGYIARKYDLISRFGKLMDPIADKFLILSAFFIFTQLRVIASWMFAVILAREVIVTGLRLFAVRKGKALAAEGAGKLKTVLQIISVYLIILFTILVQLKVDVQGYEPMMRYVSIWINILMYLVVAVTLWSGISFVWNNRREIFNAR